MLHLIRRFASLELAQQCSRYLLIDTVRSEQSSYVLWSMPKRHGDLEIELTQTVDRMRPVKLSKIRLKNTSGEARKFRVYGYAEWVLGNNQARTAPFVLSTFDEETGALLASNPYDINYPGRFAFLAGPEQPEGYTTSRREFIGRNGSLKAPAGLQQARLSGRTGGGLDPCAAIQVALDLDNGEDQDVVFRLGAARDKASALRLVHQYRGLAAASAQLAAVEQ